jgi:hypothetical protein
MRGAAPHNPRMRTALTLLLAAWPLAAAAASPWIVAAEGALVYDDNLSNAQRESDVTEDHAAALRLALGRSFAVAGGDLLVRGAARGAKHGSYSGLDHYGLGLAAGWRRKLGLGLTAPWVAADASLFQNDYREDLRDGRSALASAALGKRFGARFDASLELAYDRRWQSDDLGTVPGIPGRPFDLRGRTLALRLGAALSEPLLLSLGVATRSGDVASSTRRNQQIFRQSAAIANDPAFGPDYIAYKLTDARTTTYTADLSWALGANASLDAAWTNNRTSAPGGLDYDGNVYSLTLVYRD